MKKTFVIIFVCQLISLSTYGQEELFKLRIMPTYKQEELFKIRINPLNSQTIDSLSLKKDSMILQRLMNDINLLNQFDFIFRK